MSGWDSDFRDTSAWRSAGSRLAETALSVNASGGNDQAGTIVGVEESEWLRPASGGERTFYLLGVATLALFLAYLLATLAGAPRQTLSLVFNLAVLPLPFIAWWTYARAPAALRPLWLLCAWAATLWLLGSLVWYGFFLANNSIVPKPTGWWDIAFAAAQLLLIAAILTAIRSFALVRLAALDACVISAAGIALGVAFIGEDRWANLGWAAGAELSL
jgi:hypothetical protein